MQTIYLDTNVIENLRRVDQITQNDLMKTLIELYLDYTPEDLKQMQELTKQGEFDIVAKIAHSLKSSYCNLGAIQMLEIAEKLERLAISDEADTDKILSLILRMEDMHRNTSLALRNILI